MYFVYSMKNKVNNKLKKQELVLYQTVKNKYKKLYKTGKINKEEYYNKMKKCKKIIFYFKHEPSF